MQQNWDRIDLYADGGVVGKNPSQLGGTWAFVVLYSKEGVLVKKFFDSGVVTLRSEGVSEITNNYTEFLAVLNGCEHLKREHPENKIVYIHTDSNVTRCRFENEKPKFEGLTQSLVDRMRQVKINSNYIFRLLDGHPNKLQLQNGTGKRGQPVSKWNVFCDLLCNFQADILRFNLDTEL